MNIKRRIKEKILNYKMKLAVNLLRNIGRNMKKLGWSRQRIRRFWRDFSKSPSLREELFNTLLDINRR